ncbi:molybdopterin-dependent oxidoreductase [Massilia sp. TS11]|uniref:molybdopterin-dependent oxidoreductase n=1 Tax=Massilia sp. TS11 TaxID=2908003 RepID=UPI001ED9DE30|nr:molybdopterin-dependent oxidoreductase [Massilia sp. TS11]MCG2585290.1 molybdopterin-dependent oxidoreductase [Massilia sp. TS11]
MDKRQFLTASALASLTPALASAAPRARGPILLTISGAIGKSNRGALNPHFDQLLLKQHQNFQKAFTFDADAILSLPYFQIRPTLEYDNKVHTVRGPLLVDVLKEAGVPATSNGKLVLRAIDGFAAQISLAQARAQRFMVATHLDEQPLALGGLGPLWAVYDADRVPEMAAQPVADRFGQCPWGLYHIEVSAA